MTFPLIGLGNYSLERSQLFGCSELFFITWPVSEVHDLE
jgi:hypothetical protein